MAKAEWEIPANLQPDPKHYSFDLERALCAVVGLTSHVPEDAFTAGVLGTKRTGSGAVIGASGLIATMGYLIAEAETIWITTHSGRAVAGHALAMDPESGFGLVQALGRLDLPSLEMGDSDQVQIGDAAVFAAAGGRRHAIETRIIGRQEFAGYWEYVLDDALFTSPAHPFWGGGALLGGEGKLLGVGSLILQHGDGKGQRSDMNMVVPARHLAAFADEIETFGRARGQPRPWLGIYATEHGEMLGVGGLSEGGPADQAGVLVGDRIIAVGNEEIHDLANLWRRVWACGSAGAEVPLRLARDGRPITITVRSADRAAFYKTPKLH
jgi:S1-C subfamily serine protease